MTLPDFLIIGAMKCGTSTLQAQLARQRGIFMTSPKEPNFFSDDEVYANGIDWYENLFSAANPGDLKGEASTHYTKLPTYPETLARIRQTLKQPKLIYLIRNPLERAVSHFIHEWTMGTMSGDIDAAFDAHPELVDYGRYAYQVAPYLEAFGRDAILLSTLEEMTRAPQALLERVGAFLGHSGPLSWDEQQTKVNASQERTRRLPFDALLVDNPVATTLRRALVPKSVRARIRRGRQMSTRPTLTVERRRALEAVFSADGTTLTGLFPDVPEIAGAYPFMAS